jgi:hypothetical protein
MNLALQKQLLKQTGSSYYQIDFKPQNYWRQRFSAMLNGSLINMAASCYFRGEMSSVMSGGSGPGPNFISWLASQAQVAILYYLADVWVVGVLLVEKRLRCPCIVPFVDSFGVSTSSSRKGLGVSYATERTTEATASCSLWSDIILWSCSWIGCLWCGFLITKIYLLFH